MSGDGSLIKTPTVLQMEAVECGAASLAMVLAYHGAWVPLEELRGACGVTRDGTKANNLLKAARAYGLSAKGFKKSPSRLFDLPIPSIIHWNFNHFVVLEGFKDGCYYINDPASGRRRIEAEAFDPQFTGIVLAFEVTDTFEKRGRSAGPLSHIASQLEGSWKALGYIGLASVALVIPGIAIAGFSRVFVDNVLIGERDTWLIPLLLGMLVAMLLRGFLSWLQQAYLLRLELKLALSMASRFLWHMMQLPLAFFAQRHVGDLADRMAANDRIATLLSGQLASNVLNLASILFYTIAIAVFDPLLAAVAVALLLLNGVGLKLADDYQVSASRAVQQAGGKLAAATVSSIRTAETLKTAGFEGDAFGQWAGYQARLLSSQQQLGALSALLSALPVLLNTLTTAAILGLGGWRILEGNLSVGDIVAIQSLMASLTKPVATLVGLASSYQVIKGDLTRLKDVLAYPIEESWSGEVANYQGPARLSGRLEVADLSFGYSPLDRPLVEDFALQLESGSRVALVGASGSGKSTLGRIIAGLYEPRSGVVRLDGYSLDAIPREVFASSVAYVDQDIFLFEGTVRENLSLWNDAVTTKDITRALDDALILDDVIDREGQYDAWVQEGGLNFSGGQRQRLELARALVGDPALLILDEATAALDPISEKLIDDNLRRRGCTCLIIAHRLSTIRDCNEIIVLDHGKVVERGTHEELIALEGHYAQLLGSQA